MNPRALPDGPVSREEDTRTGSDRGRRVFPTRSPGPHGKGRVTWALGGTFRGPCLGSWRLWASVQLPWSVGWGGGAANRRSAQLLPAGIRTQCARAAAARLRSSWGKTDISASPSPQVHGF